MMATKNLQAVESIAQSWARVDWSNLQERLEKEVEEISERQNKSEEGKHRLLEESAAFRANTDKELRRAAVPLIKAFQSEIDQLSARSRIAEAALVDLFRSVLSLPDPSPFLSQFSVLYEKSERLQKCEEECGALKNHIADLQKEYSDLQNQEVTVRKLREQIRNLEIQGQSNVKLAMDETTEQLRAEFKEFEKQLNGRNDDLLAENQKLKGVIKDLELKMKDANKELEEAKARLAQKEVLEDEQLDILNRDLEQALERAEKAEREMTSLQEQIAKLNSDTTTVKENSSSSNELLLRSKEAQIHNLLEENKRLSTKLLEEASESQLRIDELTQELDRHAELVEKLETQLRSQSDYEDIKKELKILRSVEFGEESNWTNQEAVNNGLISAATATAEVQTGGRLKALDELLIEQNRKIQGENVNLRQNLQQVQDKLAAVYVEQTKKDEEIARQRDVVEKLESDLLRLSKSALRTVESSIPADPDENSSSAIAVLAGLVEEEKVGKKDPNNDMLVILSAQRDRLRFRVDDLESELRMEREKNATLENKMENIKEDNARLYGKIRFLQSYQNKLSQQTTLSIDREETESSYANQYEQHLDPFRKFALQEKQRKYAQLRPHDKAALSLGRVIMSNATSRAIFMFYLLFLHLLVFLVLYRFAFNASCQRDMQTDCIETFKSHMDKYHPDGNFGG